jgi:hypothetical protein
VGRTNPTYRDWLDRTEREWQPFRRALRRRDQADFDRLFERARGHADAAGYLNSPTPEFALFLSVLLAHERELRRLGAQLDAEGAARPDPNCDSDNHPDDARSG